MSDVAPLAHSLHVHTSSDLSTWIAFGGAVLLLGIVAIWWFGNRRSSVRLRNAKSKKRDAVLAETSRRNRVTGSALIGVVVVTAAALAVFRPEEISEPASGEPVAASSPGPDDRFPIVFEEAFDTGGFNVVVANRTDHAATVQCRVDALDSNGGSVLTDEYTAYRKDGSQTTSDVYTTVVGLDANADTSLEVRNLAISEPVARYEGRCEEIEEPEDTSA